MKNSGEEARADYRKTVNLPSTGFSMKANLVNREPEILAFWQEKDIFRKMAQKPGAEVFTLHDGPPYANGHIHLGTAFNKILKDMVVRSQLSDGKETPYRPGWDCHGMPIEHQILKKTNRQKGEVDPVSFRKEAAEFARKFVEIQKKEFQRLGVYAEWDNPYLTLLPEYEAQEVRVFGRLALEGYIYRGKRPIYWCTRCETALAEAEIEYQDLPSDSIYILFPVAEDKRGLIPEPARTSFLVWTTTPWTLPANVALLVNPDVIYGIVELDSRKLIVATDLLPVIWAKLGKEPPKPEKTFPGADLVGLLARHPFIEQRTVPVVPAAFVSAEDGSGIVHSAPGHGAEDFIVGREYNLPVLSPVNEKGAFTADVPEWAGLSVWEANPQIIERLRSDGRLVLAEQLTHSYPTCWRCKKPVIFRATEQWFLNIEQNNLRQQLLTTLEKVHFLPPESRNRLAGMLETRPDWCLSRQRHWGVPVPVVRCRQCQQPQIVQAVFDRIADVFEQEGSDVWFSRPAEYFTPADFQCGCGGRDFEKEKDILDVWFDSGTSWAGVMEPAGHFPVDLYLEGSDQHRGWFQTSLITGCAARGKAPYRNVLTHGFIVDEAGRKMSKSLGNVVSPEDVLKNFGADILRLWAAGQDYRQDVQAGPAILNQVAGQYRTLRNTLRFILGNLADFQPEKDTVDDAGLRLVDRWALQEVYRLREDVLDLYRQFAFFRAAGRIYDFCNLTLSSFYLDTLKDRLYTCGASSPERRSGQTALYRIGRTLVHLLSPILVFTCEEAWQHLPRQAGDPESIHLLTFEKLDRYADEELQTRFGAFFEIRRRVLKEIEEVRCRGILGSGLEARVEIRAAGKDFELLSGLREYLPELFIVSEVFLFPAEPAAGLEIKISATALPKCPRCWVHGAEIGRQPEFPDLCPKCAKAVKEHDQNAAECNPPS